ncbi:uncharacterized protein DS421_19g669130 [Arachis hypogaea]|uniref:Uncharacterized protein n=1 Tax=Arachis hypogaea TaxID=3818 RepID=A0A6B9VCU9_ARAHY|nr:uncharacterized protein DS421_19g669130 [Arachis hypogaea]
MEFNNVAPDGSYVGHGRMGRKPLNDGSYIPPRRRSPGGRDGIQWVIEYQETLVQVGALEVMVQRWLA